MREEGYYWVKINEEDNYPVPAQYYKGGYWFLTGDETSYEDDFFYKIYENKINFTMKQTIEVNEIPEGYELDDSYIYVAEHGDVIMSNSWFVRLPLKKKEVKDWDWYIKNYVDDNNLFNISPISFVR
jgi:hypothetical protein